jgi:DNA repair exonuclease SbcCD ATPase subunit
MTVTELCDLLRSLENVDLEDIESRLTNVIEKVEDSNLEELEDLDFGALKSVDLEELERQVSDLDRRMDNFEAAEEDNKEQAKVEAVPQTVKDELANVQSQLVVALERVGQLEARLAETERFIGGLKGFLAVLAPK